MLTWVFTASTLEVIPMRAMFLTAVVAAPFVARIAPLQRQATAQAIAFANQASRERPESFERVARRIEPLSQFARVLFIAVVAPMIFKPALPLPR